MQSPVSCILLITPCVHLWVSMEYTCFHWLSQVCDLWKHFILWKLFVWGFSFRILYLCTCWICKTKNQCIFFLLPFENLQCPMAPRLRLFMKKRSKMNKGRAVRMSGSKWDLATNHRSLDRLTSFRPQLLIFLVVI